MDFAFSEEQQMLRDSARSYLSSKFSGERVAELAESEEGWDRDSWREMAELGWLGLSVPEDRGGAGSGFLEEAVVFEELGRALYPGPYFATVALALPALEGAEQMAKVVAGEATATFAWAEPGTRRGLGDLEGLSTKATTSNGSWTLAGEKSLVVDGSNADMAVVAAATPEGPALFLVDLSGAQVAGVSTMDATRRLATIILQDAEALLLVHPQDTAGVVDRIRLRLHASLALEAVGVAQAALDLAIAHVKERHQFGKPIGAYQAVAHQVVDSYIATELARSLAYWAAWCVAEADDRSSVAVAAAKSAAAEAAVEACERSIQVHGGIGFTWEHVLHRYYKRAQWIAAFDLSGREQRSEIVSGLFDR